MDPSAITHPLQKLINDFLNELQLSFEDKLPNISSVRKDFDNACKTEESFSTFSVDIQSCISPYEEQFNRILFSQRKVKSKQYEFLNELKMFNGQIDFAVLSDETKSTKKTLIQYLHSMLLMCKLTTGNFELSGDQLGILEGFLEPSAPPESPSEGTNSRPKKHVSHAHNKRSHQRAQANPLGNLSTLMDSVMSNPDIVNIAKEISADIQSQNIDPMSMINGLMSGKPSSQLEGLINKIGTKIDQKISSGEIDKNTLEQQAQNILQNVDLGETLKQTLLGDPKK